MKIKLLWDQGKVARYLGVSPRTLEAWRVRGIGPPFLKIGWRVRYQPLEVVTWAEQQARTATHRESEPPASQTATGCVLRAAPVAES